MTKNKISIFSLFFVVIGTIIYFLNDDNCINSCIGCTSIYPILLNTVSNLLIIIGLTLLFFDIVFND